MKTKVIVNPGDRFKNKFGVEFVVRDVTPSGGAFMEAMGSFAGMFSEKEIAKMTPVEVKEQTKSEAELTMEAIYGKK